MTHTLGRFRHFGGCSAIWLPFALLLFALLSACGGGGGDVNVPAIKPPVIRTQPASVTVAVGEPAQFAVVADGDGIVYAWLRSVNGGLSWAPVTGASGSSLSIASVDASMNGYRYRVVLQNISGIVTSEPATLSVAGAPVAPVITAEPADASVAVGAAASFAVTATGTSLAYQWQRSADGVVWADITGATAARFDLAAASLGDSGARWRVVVSNTAGQVTSRVASLTVTANGGGGGGGGVPVACVPPDVLPVGMVIQSGYAIDIGGVAGTPQQATLTVVGPSTFQGRSVFETRTDTPATLLPGSVRAFTTWDATTRNLTVWGAISHFEVGPTVLDVTSVTRQPAQYPAYALAVGQSATVTGVTDNTAVTTTNGTAGAPVVTVESETSTYTFLGTETLVVPAGTFLTCKLREQAAGSAQPSTVWRMAGFGAVVKSTSGSTTQTLTSISVNGSALLHFP